jgi:predicted P-loop ATPase
LRIFIYRDAAGQQIGYSCRFLTSTGEAVHLPLTWCHDHEGMRAWRWIQFQKLRPLYGLDLIAAADEVANFLLVFDEHAAEYAKQLLPWLTVISWPGGTRKIDEVDWSILRGRSVWIWPTLTRHRAKQRRDVESGPGKLLPRDKQPGWQAALKLEKILLSYGCAVPAIADPFSDESLPDGFDAGMAGTQSWSPEQTEAWFMGHLSNGLGTEVQQRIRKLKGETEPPAEPASTPSGASAGQGKEDVWIPELIYRNGDLLACLSNVYQILSHRPEWKGVVAFDEFSLRVVKRRPPPFEGGGVGDWNDTDDARAAMLLQRQYEFTPSSALVSEAIRVLADANRFHPVREWFASLEWDGEKRLKFWLTKYLGTKESEYSMRVAVWWLMGAVKRALEPGCKFDYCLVLEGPQGKGKSTVFSILGGDWFGDTDLDFANKDAMVALGGKLIYELAELGALARSDERRQKSFLSRRFDEYRPHYGRSMIKAPRQLVFGGSTNEWEWNKDPTGGRRFWPIACEGDLDLDGLRKIRDQLFAEAYRYVMAGARYWPTPEEQKLLFDPEQLRVEQPDAYVDALHDWVFLQVKTFSLATAAMEGLKLDASKLTRDAQTRIGIALRKLGCKRVEKRNGMTRFWYEPPEKTAESMTGQPAQQAYEDGDGYF